LNKFDLKKALLIGIAAWVAGIIVFVVTSILGLILGIGSLGAQNLGMIFVLASILVFIISLVLTGIVLPITLKLFGFDLK
jgi:hypothetical protein